MVSDCGPSMDDPQIVSDYGPSMDTLPPSPLSFPLSPIEVWSQLLEHPVTCLATISYLCEYAPWMCSKYYYF